MKMKQVADKFGKHDNTIRNWSEWYADFLSPAPPKGEARVFTDEDFRILAFINELSDKGLNRQAIYDALKQKYDSNSPFPPVHPDMLINKDPNQETALALQEAQGVIARKDAEIKHLSATVTELREQIGYLRSAQEQERAQFNKRIDELMDKYMSQADRLGQKHADEIARLSHELGKLQQQVQEASSQDTRHREAETHLNKTIEDLTRRLEETSRNSAINKKKLGNTDQA